MSSTSGPGVSERIRASVLEATQAAEGEGDEGQVPGDEPAPQEPAHEPVEHTSEPAPEPAPEPEPPEQSSRRQRSDEPSDRELRAFKREQERHEAAIRELMGDDVAGFDVCEHCNGIGLVPPLPQPRTHEFFRECSTCTGYGQVLTGSRRQGHELRDCPECAGRGFVEALDAQGSPLAGAPRSPAAVIATAPAVVAVELPPNGSQAPAELRFGTPQWMGDPNVGR